MNLRANYMRDEYDLGTSLDLSSPPWPGFLDLQWKGEASLWVSAFTFSCVGYWNNVGQPIEILRDQNKCFKF